MHEGIRALIRVSVAVTVGTVGEEEGTLTRADMGVVIRVSIFVTLSIRVTASVRVRVRVGVRVRIRVRVRIVIRVRESSWYQDLRLLKKQVGKVEPYALT